MADGKITIPCHIEETEIGTGPADRKAITTIWPSAEIKVAAPRRFESPEVPG
jgi:hypothetical protein